MLSQPWIFPALSALLLWGVGIFLPKLVVARMGAASLIVYHTAVFFITASIALVVSGNGLAYEPVSTVMAVLLGLAGTVGQFSFILALRQGPTGPVVVITSLYPLVSVLLALMFLEDELSRQQWAGVAAGILALPLLAAGQRLGGQMREGSRHWMVPAAMALLIWGVWAFLPKIVLQELPPESLIFYEGIGNLLFSVPLYFLFLRGKVERDIKGIGVAASASVLTVLAVLAYFYALQTGPVSIIAPLTALYPVIALVLARAFLHEKLSPAQAGGVVMAVGAGVLLAG